jgi:hypothetical protein
MDHDYEKQLAALYANGRRPSVDELLALDEAGPNLLRGPGGSKTQFRNLWRNLGMTKSALARLLGRPFGTVKAWSSPARPDMVPPEEVLQAMRKALLDRATDVVRQNGLDVIPRRRAA